MSSNEERVIFGRIPDLDRHELQAEFGATTLESERRFFHYRPQIVSNDPDANHSTPAVWEHVRFRQNMLIQEFSNCFVFGSNFIVDAEQNVFFDSLKFRRSGFEFYSRALRGASPASMPECLFADGGMNVSWPKDAMREAIDIDEPVYLLTPIEPDNWGRWIRLVLPRLEYVKRLDPARKILLKCPSKWQKEFLAFCNIDPANVIDHDPTRIYHIRNLKMFRHNSVDLTVSFNDFERYGNIAERFRNRPDLPKNIYLGRKNLSSINPRYRVLENEEKFMAELKKLNFVCFEPELYTIEAKIAWFANAKNFVGLGGSSIYNSVFCRDDARYITVESQPTFLPTHTGLLASLALWHGVVFGRPVDLAQCGANAHANWTIDVDRAMGVISQGLR